MAKSARRMRHSARRMHRGGATPLSPAPLGDVVAGPVDPAQLEELGFGAGGAVQAGGRRHRSRKHHKRGGKKHSRKTHKRGGKKHSRKHHKRGGKKHSRKHSRKHHGKRH